MAGEPGAPAWGRGGSGEIFLLEWVMLGLHRGVGEQDGGVDGLRHLLARSQEDGGVSGRGSGAPHGPDRHGGVRGER